MLELLWLIPSFPLVGFLILGLAGKRLSRVVVATIGAGSVGISALLAVLIALRFFTAPPADQDFAQVLWHWMSAGTFDVTFGLYLDPLAVVMMLVVTVIGFLIHLYSTEFMVEDEDYSRFFAYLNLFVGMMLILVLAGDFIVLYLGWEGVGLCSYLLIGFWYTDPDNGRAARKAFIVTRIGDALMLVALLLLATRLGTLNIQDVLVGAAQKWAVGSTLATAAALLLLGGAIGKSAQLPLQVWLPDAMAGPTPVSALIHAATMVTAGVYLIARTHALFSLAPGVLILVALIGGITLLLSGFSALTQRDIKRVLAYSTISQIGYMFLALGVGAWSAAVFHLVTHACFKALLFLGAGAVISGVGHEHDIFRMGGLRRQLPTTFWTFLIASAALAGFPLVTAGFYSKDMILWHAWSSGPGGFWLWAAGYVGVGLTSLYIFRVVFLVFFGQTRTAVDHHPGWRIKIPLVVLAFLSVVAGLIEIPRTLGGFPLLSDFLESTFGVHSPEGGSFAIELVLQIAAAVLVIAGIFVAWRWYLQRPLDRVEREGLPHTPTVLQRFWFEGWGFDDFNQTFLVRPYHMLARAGRDDVVDQLYRLVAWIFRSLHYAIRRTQNGRVRWYVGSLATGAVLAIALVVFR